MYWAHLDQDPTHLGPWLKNKSLHTHAHTYIYHKLLEEVDMEKKKSIKSKRIQNFSSQEVDMEKKRKEKEVHNVKLEKI